MFLFKKKVETDKIKTLEQQLYYSKKEIYNDFISILEQIQKTNNKPMQWKQKMSTIDNQTESAIQKYRNKILELDINA